MAQRPDVHVIPTDDRIKHHDSSLCVCRPQSVEDDDAVFWLHNAADGREYAPLLADALTGWILVGPRDLTAGRPVPLRYANPN